MHNVGRMITAVLNGELPVHGAGHRIHTLHACMHTYALHTIVGTLEVGG